MDLVGVIPQDTSEKLPVSSLVGRVKAALDFSDQDLQHAIPWALAVANVAAKDLGVRLERAVDAEETLSPARV